MLEKIMKRLDEEVKKLEAEMPEKQMYLWGKYVEAAYLRATFLQMIEEEEKKGKQPMTEAEILKMINDMWQERIKERENN